MAAPPLAAEAWPLEGGSTAVLRPRAPLRRGRLARVAAAFGALPLVAAVVLSGLRVEGPPAPLAAGETLVFVALPGSLRLLRYPTEQIAESKVARRAGYEGKPGGRPGAEEVAAAEPKPPKLRPGEETEGMQEQRVEKRSRWLKTLKGKFVPWGPKPWDKHRFMKVCIQTRLKSKQAANTKIINQVVEELRRVTGMHPWVVKAKHNVAAFGWRKGYPCGVAVTLYGARMYDFLARLNTIVLPRIRDFEGLIPNSFDNYGNFWMGIENQEPFKELDELIDSREVVHGFDIGIINNCLTQPDGLALMKKYGFPFGDPRPKRAMKIKKSFVVMRKDDKKK